MTVRILDSELVLRDAASGAVTSTTSETGVAVDNASLDDYKVAFHVLALDTADADETYTLAVEVDTDSGFSTAVSVGSIDVTAKGNYEIPLSRNFVELKEAGASWMRVTATLGGTTPSITYGAFLVPTV